ncbi:putative acid phosphatase, partial [Colletotrichum musicola]
MVRMLTTVLLAAGLAAAAPSYGNNNGKSCSAKKGHNGGSDGKGDGHGKGGDDNNGGWGHGKGPGGGKGPGDGKGPGGGYGHPTATISATPVNTAADIQYTSTASADVAAAAATAKTESPTSNVKGKAFDRIVQIYLETTAYENATANADCQALIDQGILLTNMYGIGTPSQPNYVAPASGDDFGTNSDSFLLVDKNVSTIVDLLEDKYISWGDYNEGLPYTGFEGFEYSNPVEGNYARKHNLLVRFDSVTLEEHRLARLKNLTLFYEDLNANRLPQWAFITPNLYNNGHDTNISVSCNWTRSFVEPLLKNPNFDNGNTVVYITWQANGQNPLARNHVAGILLGSAVPKELVGSKDPAFYNHYSELSSVEANWGLHTLGRWDVGANVWSFVARKTGDVIREWNVKIAGDAFENYYWNQSYGG